MYMRPNDLQLGPAAGKVSAVRHRATCLARWLRLPGTTDTPDFLSIRYWNRPDPARADPRRSRAPVVLVHGYASTEHMWHPLRRALADAGFDEVIAVRYNTFRADIQRAADWLRAQAERTMTACGADGVHLIGHSLGGLVVREAMQSRGLADHVRTAVTVATPHHGSPFARFVPGPCARQMLPGSAFLRALAARGHCGPTRWIDIEGTADRVVAAGPSPQAPDLVRVRHGAGHRSITRHPDVVTRIVDELTDVEDRTAADRFELAA